MVASRSLIGAAIAIAVTLAGAPTARAWCQMTSSGRRPEPGECIVAEPPDTWPLAWDHRCTSISLSRQGSRDMTEQEVRAVFEGAIATWESVTCDGAPTGLDVTILDELNGCTEASHFTGDSNVHTVLFVEDGWTEERMHDARAYAVTLVWHDPRSGAIWDVDMEINEQRGPYGVCPVEGCPPGLVDLPNVVTHEMGHYFGLAHTPDDSLATMWASAEPDETLKRDLREDDIEGFCAIYPPGSLPEECDTTPRGGLNLECVRHDDGCSCSAPGARAGAGSAGLVGALGLAIAIAARRRKRGRGAR